MTKTQQDIDEALAIALDNGFDEMKKWSVDEIAEDLICYHHEFDYSKVEELRPFIIDWLDRQ